MAACRCAPPGHLHITAAGVHLAEGAESALVLVDEVWADEPPRCTVCGDPISSTFYRCAPCHAVICRACVAADTVIVECDCEPAMPVTGVELAARRAAAQLIR